AFSVREILAGEAPKEAPVTVKGWVRTRRDSKAGISFVHLSDGSSFHPVQVVAPNTLPNYTDEVLKLTAGCALEATGTIVPSRAKGQPFEMQASAIKVIGWVEDPDTYPIQPKPHTLEFLRDVAHLRPRTNTIAAATRVRHTLAQAIHRFFDENGFLWVNTPIITASDAEGAGALFRGSTKKPVIVMKYPKDIKAFYMRVNDDGRTVAAMDVLAPGIGEIIGGSQREERLEVLDARMAERGIDKEHYAWYRDLRRYGTVPHAGFGLGFERTLAYVTGLANVRDAIPFPPTPRNPQYSGVECRLSKSALEAEIGHDVSAFIFDHVGTLRALERRLGVFIAERRGFLVIGFGGARILRSAAPALCKRAHALQGARMILRRRLFEQRARRNVILRSADALRDHQAELILRFRRIRFRRFRQQGSGLDGLRRCAAALVEGREIGGAAGIAARGAALEHLARWGFVLGNARSSREQRAELDHGRRASLVGGFAIGADGFRKLLIVGVGAAELVKRPPRCSRRELAEFDRRRDIRRLDLVSALDVLGLVRIGGIGGRPGPQHRIGGLSPGSGMKTGKRHSAQTAAV